MAEPHRLHFSALPGHPARNSQIDVTSYDLEETLANERRRQIEARKSQDLVELDQMLAPLAIAISRLTARMEAGLSMREMPPPATPD